MSAECILGFPDTKWDYEKSKRIHPKRMQKMRGVNLRAGKRNRTISRAGPPNLSLTVYRATSAHIGYVLTHPE